MALPAPHLLPTPPFTPAFTPHEQERFSPPDPNAAYGVRFDLFPAEVSFLPPATDGAPSALMTFPKCRVLIGTESVYVFIDGPRGPVCAFVDHYDAETLTGDLPVGFELDPASPDLTGVGHLSIRPTNACGCGSRLRGFRPFGRLSYIPSPG